MDTWDEWDETGEPVKRANIVRRTFNRVWGKVRKIKNSMRFFFVKLHISEKEYLAIKNCSDMWLRVSDAFRCRVDNDDVEAKDSSGNVLLRFTKASTYSLTIDANKIRKAFFRDGVPVEVSVVENEM